MERMPEYAAKYNETNVGRYWNYLFTPQCYEWAVNYPLTKEWVIDGFSPNLNKSLHIGHLRQLVLANSLSKLLGDKGKFVSLLGASQGVHDYAVRELEQWFNFVGYQPTLYRDTDMDESLVPRTKDENPDSPTFGCELWNNKVIVTRSDGRHTYAFHDIAFAASVRPTHYITGVEQKEHFESLGLGDKHLPMGLVLGADGTKLKSRDNTDGSVKAEAVIAEIMAKLGDTCPEKRKLAWNVIAYNLLCYSRGTNARYNPDDWTHPDKPGLYITYTYARINKALKGVMVDGVPELTQEDVNLVGFSEYMLYYVHRSVETLDATTLASYAYDLARRLSKAYHAEKIQGGRPAFQYAVMRANSVLQQCMTYLGMFHLETV